jgi:undecaprenyl-diphosphatase
MRRPTFSTEGLPLASLFGLAALLLMFGMIASLVFKGAALAFDRDLLLYFRNERGASAMPAWVTHAAQDITSLGSTSVVTLVVIVALGYLLLTRKKGVALLVFAAVAGGAALNHLLKGVFGRARPDIVEPLVPVFTASFPSGHAAASAITYLTLSALLARTADSRPVRVYIVSAGTLLTLLVGTSRVYLGVHYPTDVLAGWCVGAAWALLCWIAMQRFQQEGAVEAPGDRDTAVND